MLKAEINGYFEIFILIPKIVRSRDGVVNSDLCPQEAIIASVLSTTNHMDKLHNI